VDAHAILTSRDGGATWTARPFTPENAGSKEFQISNERVLFRTREGVLVLSFMNLNERVWTWSNEIKDARPGCRLPQYVVRSLDNAAHELGLLLAGVFRGRPLVARDPALPDRRLQFARPAPPPALRPAPACLEPVRPGQRVQARAARRGRHPVRHASELDAG
jgi:hypothetical protein